MQPLPLTCLINSSYLCPKFIKHVKWYKWERKQKKINSLAHVIHGKNKLSFAPKIMYIPIRLKWKSICAVLVKSNLKPANPMNIEYRRLPSTCFINSPYLCRASSVRYTGPDTSLWKTSFDIVQIFQTLVPTLVPQLVAARRWTYGSHPRTGRQGQ